MKSNLMPLGELIDMLIDIEQSQGREGEALMAKVPVVAAWPDVAMIRVKEAKTMIHTSRLPLFGIMQGERYINLKLA